MTESGTNPGLFDLPGTEAGAIGEMEREAREQLNAMHDSRAFTAHQQVIAKVAISLARNIDRGNLKGRAIGNEATQLVASMQLLAGEEIDPNAEGTLGIPAETERFLHALTQPPRVDPAPGGAGTPLRDSA